MDKATILIVDDEVEILKSLSAILEDEFNVLATSNGKDVPSILEANSVSLLVLDLRMPEMTGLELIESIRGRNNSGGNEIPILVVTGDYNEQDKQLAAHNVQGCIKKPVDIKMLRDKIQMILKKITYAFLILYFMVTTSTAYAERIGIGAGIGFMNFQEPAMSILNGPKAYPSVSLSFGVDSHTSIELSVGRVILKGLVRDPRSPTGTDLITVEITSIPIFLTVQPRLHLGNFSPYIGGGIGYYFNNGAETPSEIKDYVRVQRLTTDPNYNITQDVGNVYGAHATIGGDYFISKNVAYGIDIKQSWAWGIVTTRHTGSSGTTTYKDRLDFNATIITAGVKYLF